MVVLVGRATRLSRWLLRLRKYYEATVRFGETTDTLDPEGETIETGPLPDPGDVAVVLDEFTGEIEQVPPAFSAVKVGGERSYRLARKGATPELTARTVEISSLNATPINASDFVLSIECSSGTYVRSLARDIGKRLGTVAHLVALRRTRVGPFSVESACTLDETGPPPELVPLGQILGSLPGLGTVTLETRQVEQLKRGVPIAFLDLAEKPDGEYALFTPDGEPLAIAESNGHGWRYVWVLARA
jgi:tRNA pseudouridine55 synthase